MWFIGLRSAVKPREEWNVTLDEHLAWMKRQHEAGKIVMSGPTPDRKLGIYLIRADSREEAEGIAGSDPYTAAGFCTFELIEWELHQVMGAGPFSLAEIKAQGR
ncbi:MAG: YciI family protein [Deltaproteobacteria bacterium]|nr:YciI family protein [Deltaproteobacteria bacterium]